MSIFYLLGSNSILAEISEGLLERSQWIVSYGNMEDIKYFRFAQIRLTNIRGPEKAKKKKKKRLVEWVQVLSRQNL